MGVINIAHLQNIKKKIRSRVINNGNYFVLNIFLAYCEKKYSSERDKFWLKAENVQTFMRSLFIRNSLEL